MKYSLAALVITSDQTVRDLIETTLPSEGDAVTVTTVTTQETIFDPADPLNIPPDPEPEDWNPTGATLIEYTDTDVQNKWAVFQVKNELFAHVHFNTEADRDTYSASVMALTGMLEQCDPGTFVREYDYDEVTDEIFETTLYEVV